MCGAEKLAKIDALESHERDLVDDNRRLEHHLVTDRVEKESHEPRDLQSTKDVIDAKVQHSKVQEALRLLEGWTSADRSALPSSIGKHDFAQNEVMTT